LRPRLLRRLRPPRAGRLPPRLRPRLQPVVPRPLRPHDRPAGPRPRAGAGPGRRALVVAGGDPPPPELVHRLWADLVVAADSGAAAVLAAGRVPHLVVGDLDSLDQPLPPGAEVERHPRDKDQSDLELAVAAAV